MSQLVMMIAQIDDLDNPDTMTELWRCHMPSIDVAAVMPQQYLDGLENTVMDVGWEAMRTLMVEQWRLTDRLLVERFRKEHPEVVNGDGHDPLKVASRLGILQLPRQVCYRPGEDQHTLPGNTGLPEHAGQVTTRGLQEWVCILPQDLPFGTSQRLLGWMTHDPEVLSETQERRWVCAHGQIIRQAEKAEAEALLERPNLDGLQAQLTPAKQPRRLAAWPKELNAVVETALSQPEACPPEGVGKEDWERVLQARHSEAAWQPEDLRRLGPAVRVGQIIASTDDIEVRRPQKRKFLELRTAYVRTVQGYHYLSGPAAVVLQQLYLLLVLCGGGISAKVTLLGDGAHWIANFFQERLAAWPLAELIVDWYHCRKKCYDLTSLIAHGHTAKTELLGLLLIHLWRGQVQEAIDILEEYRPQTKNLAKLDELIAYLDKRRPYLPNYQARRIQQKYIGSAHTEKTNDLIVARRQ
jgi:hypothetical protein